MEIVQIKDIRVGDSFYFAVGDPHEVVEVAVGQHRAALKYRDRGREAVTVHPIDHEFAVDRAELIEVQDNVAELTEDERTDEELDLLDAADRDRADSEQSEPVETGADEIVFADERDNT